VQNLYIQLALHPLLRSKFEVACGCFVKVPAFRLSALLARRPAFLLNTRIFHPHSPLLI
jgi:hypothetical protein